MTAVLPKRWLNRITVVDDCWIWSGALNSKGYGSAVNPLTGKVGSTHKIAYELANGPVPDGLQLDHLCRNKPCCNPAHLEPVTSLVNNHRAHDAKGVGQSRTHCPDGHEFTPENTNLRRGRRECLACKREYNRRYMAARRAAA